MSTYGEMEAQWRDQQSGARDHKYDEEELQEQAEEYSRDTENETPQSAEHSLLPNCNERIGSRGATGSQGTGEKDGEAGNPGPSDIGDGIAGSDPEKRAA